MLFNKLTSLSLLKAFGCAIVTVGLVTLANAQSAKIDPTGTWTWTNPGRNGSTGSTNTLVLRYSNNSLTGTLTSPARGGHTTSSTIEDGAFSGEKVSFKVIRTMGSNTMTATYAGVVTADSIKGTMATERNGQARSRKWEAKRESGGTN